MNDFSDLISTPQLIRQDIPFVAKTTTTKIRKLYMRGDFKTTFSAAPPSVDSVTKNQKETVFSVSYATISGASTSCRQTHLNT